MIFKNTEQQQPIFSNTHNEIHSNETNKEKIPGTCFQYEQQHDQKMDPDNERSSTTTTFELRPNGNVKMTFDQLPNEIKSSIINHLSEQHRPSLYECALVNKQFNTMTIPLLYQVITIKDYGKRPSQRFLECISSTNMSSERLSTLGQHVWELRINGLDESTTDEQFLRLFQHIPQLERFVIWGDIYLNDATLIQIPYYCQQLQSIHLSYNTIPEVFFSAMGQYCHQLTDFLWELSSDQSAEWLAWLCPSCPLTSLALVIDEDITAKTKMAIQSFQQLTSLKLNQERPSNINFLLLPQQQQQQPVSYWPALTKLSLIGCDDLMESTWLEFIKLHPHIEQLQLVGIFQLSDAIFDAMTTWCLKLTDIYLNAQDLWAPSVGYTSFSSDGIRRLIKGCPHLIKVQLFNCPSVLPEHFFPESLNDSRSYPNMTKVIKLEGWMIEKVRQTNTEH